MPNEEFTLTTAREALERCWSNGASGSHEVAPGRYVQWARWPEGVQVECSSDAFWQEGSCHSCSDASSPSSGSRHPGRRCRTTGCASPGRTTWMLRLTR